LNIVTCRLFTISYCDTDGHLV